MLKNLLFGFALLGANTAVTQTLVDSHFCGADVQHDKMSADPTFRDSVKNEQQKIVDHLRKKQQSQESSPNYTIPVVIHIISPPGTPLGQGNNLTNLQIEAGLKNLNHVFANEPPFFSPDGVNTGISFCLARRGPNGQPTNGINRVESTMVADNACNGFATPDDKESEIKDLSRWDCTRYLNVWLVTNLYYKIQMDCGLLGFAYYPGSGCTIDGVFMESYFWDKDWGTYVTGHEMGHYFNLRHTFAGGCGSGSCVTEGDFVCDTPPDASPTFSPCDVNSCHTDIPDLIDNSYNYMDYSNCYPHHFTQGQGERMIACLEVNRAGLISQNYCQPLTNTDAAILDFSLDKGSCGTLACPTLRVKNNGLSTINSLKISYRIINGSSQTYNWIGTLPPNDTAVIQLSCLSVNLGVQSLSVNIEQTNGQNDDYAEDNTFMLQNITFFPVPQLTVVQVDSAICGLGGKIQINATDGTLPLYYSINTAPITYQAGKIFEDLPAGDWWIKVTDQNHCLDSVKVIVPNTCPPCLGGVINHYAAVQGACQNSVLSVDNIFGFEPGVKVLIIQMQGAIIDSTEHPDFGTLVDLRQAGIYEINQIVSADNNTLQLAYQLANQYDFSKGKVQVVTIPNIGDEDICNITCKNWDGNSGGVIIFEGNEINLIGNIDASAKGFRGAKPEFFVNSFNCGTSNFAAPRFSAKGGLKGEGISNVLSENLLQCRGRYANGGGGGNDHNAGGGGGGNFGAGGMGGYETKDGCNGSFNAATRGQGGLKLAYAPTSNRIYMGGGGGGGEGEWVGNGTATQIAGNGGGIVMVFAKKLTTSGGIIKSNGGNVPNVPNGMDGQSGGGGGGTIFIDCEEISGGVNIEAKGGNGGSVTANFIDPKHGPGGGGGGGTLLLHSAQSNLNPILTGGKNGITDGNDPHGALPGDVGGITYNWTVTKADQPSQLLKISSINIQKTPCADQYNIKVNMSNPTIPVTFSVNGGNWQNDPTIIALPSGNIVLKIKSDCIEKDTLLQLPHFQPLRDSLVGVGHFHCGPKGNILVAGLGGTPPYRYRINNGPWQTNGVFPDLTAGTFMLTIQDSEQCERLREVTIFDYSQPLNITIDSSFLVNNCNEALIFIAASASGSIPYYAYSLDGLPLTPQGYFIDLSTGFHSIVAYDEFGCKSLPYSFEVINEIKPVILQFNPILCGNEVFRVGSKTYTQTGIYSDTIISPIGCDSIFNVNLTIYPHTDSLIKAVICEGEPFEINGKNYGQAGIFTDSLPNQFGCDSLITIDLSIIDTFHRKQNFRICRGDTLNIDGVAYTIPGTFPRKIPDGKGCDSLVVTIIEISSEQQCRERDCKMYVPNTFSPQSGGDNRYFEIFSEAVKLTEMDIFDRWGSLVYSVKSQSLIWDGNDASGRSVQAGIYTVKIDGICADGQGITTIKEIAVMR